MHPIIRWGLDFIEAVQRMGSPTMDAFFRCITLLGDELFFLLLLPFFLWCVDFPMGIRLGCYVLLSQYVNIVAKDLFRLPRPAYYRPELARVEQGGYGLPSGHAQTTMTLWGSVAVWAGKAWVRVAAAVLILMVGFSRIYLGVHFPTDVLAGWGIGAVLLALFFAVTPAVEERLARMGLIPRIVLALALPILLALIHPAWASARRSSRIAGPFAPRVPGRSGSSAISSVSRSWPDSTSASRRSSRARVPPFTCRSASFATYFSASGRVSVRRGPSSSCGWRGRHEEPLRARGATPKKPAVPYPLSKCKH